MKPSKLRRGNDIGGKPSIGGPRLQTGMVPGGKPSMVGPLPKTKSFGPPNRAGGPRLQTGMGPGGKPSMGSSMNMRSPAMTPTPTATQAGAMAPRAPIAGPRQVNAATSGSMFAKGGEVKKTGGTARGFGMAKPSKFKIY
jgi:hypothetical protein